MKNTLNIAIATLALSSASAQVTFEKITFESHGETLVGHLYLPEAQTDTMPAVVITGAWTTVKEQMPTNYAREMAAKGYAALVFDFRGWGESSGELRYLESPERKTEDILAAIDYLASLDKIDSNRIGGLGICASAGYMSDAAIYSPNLKSIALVAPWLHDAEIVDAVYGGAASVNGLIEVSRAAEDTPNILEAASLTNENSVMFQVPYYTDPETGLVPEYDNKFNAASWEPWLTYDAIAGASKLQKPNLLVHSEDAAIPQGARKYAEILGEYASTAWLDDISQFDFYSDQESVDIANALVAKHFNETL